MKFRYLIILLALGFWACEKPEYQLDVAITDHTPYFAHTWELVSVQQIDHKAGPGKLKRLDISSSVLAAGASEVTFTESSFNASGLISELLGESGTWSLDNAEFPTAIRVSNAEGQTEIPLEKAVLSFSNQMQIRNDVYNCVDGTLATGYVYVFNKK